MTELTRAGAITRVSTKIERVDRCIAMMREGKWVRGQSVRDLAGEYGVSERELSRDAAEASRHFLPDAEERDEAIACWYAKLAEGQRQALDKGDLRALSSLLGIEGQALRVVGFGNKAHQLVEALPGNIPPDEVRARLIDGLVQADGPWDSIVREALTRAREEHEGLHRAVCDTYALEDE